MHVMIVTYGEPKKGYLNFTLGNLWETQPIALLIWPPLNISGLELARKLKLSTHVNIDQKHVF